MFGLSFGRKKEVKNYVDSYPFPEKIKSTTQKEEMEKVFNFITLCLTPEQLKPF